MLIDGSSPVVRLFVESSASTLLFNACSLLLMLSVGVCYQLCSQGCCHFIILNCHHLVRCLIFSAEQCCINLVLLVICKVKEKEDSGGGEREKRKGSLPPSTFAL